jgi:hypothetical protein
MNKGLQARLSSAISHSVRGLLRNVSYEPTYHKMLILLIFLYYTLIFYKTHNTLPPSLNFLNLGHIQNFPLVIPSSSRFFFAFNKGI